MFSNQPSELQQRVKSALENCQTKLDPTNYKYHEKFQPLFFSNNWAETQWRWIQDQLKSLKTLSESQLNDIIERMTILNNLLEEIEKFNKACLNRGLYQKITPYARATYDASISLAVSLLGGLSPERKITKENIEEVRLLTTSLKASHQALLLFTETTQKLTPQEENALLINLGVAIENLDKKTQQDARWRSLRSTICRLMGAFCIAAIVFSIPTIIFPYVFYRIGKGFFSTCKSL